MGKDQFSAIQTLSHIFSNVTTIPTAAVGRGSTGSGAVGGLAVTLEKMRESVWVAENLSLPSIANGVGVGCKRALASARAAVVEALVELPDGTGQSCGKNSTALAMRSARVRGM